MLRSLPATETVAVPGAPAGAVKALTKFCPVGLPHPVTKSMNTAYSLCSDRPTIDRFLYGYRQSKELWSVCANERIVAAQKWRYG